MLGFYVSASGAIHGRAMMALLLMKAILMMTLNFLYQRFTLRSVCFGLDLFLPSIMLQTYTQERI